LPTPLPTSLHDGEGGIGGGVQLVRGVDDEKSRRREHVLAPDVKGKS
jgi:hypothetical protein